MGLGTFGDRSSPGERSPLSRLCAMPGPRATSYCLAEPLEVGDLECSSRLTWVLPGSREPAELADPLGAGDLERASLLTLALRGGCEPEDAPADGRSRCGRRLIGDLLRFAEPLRAAGLLWLSVAFLLTPLVLLSSSLGSTLVRCSWELRGRRCSPGRGAAAPLVVPPGPLDRPVCHRAWARSR